MKVKVIIENGETTIILTPENEFEIDVIEKVHCKKEKHSIHTDFYAQYNYGTYSKHKIELSINVFGFGEGWLVGCSILAGCVCPLLPNPCYTLARVISKNLI